MELQDNGLGADRVAGDGLYAKYFVDFANSGVMFACHPSKQSQHWCI